MLATRRCVSGRSASTRPPGRRALACFSLHRALRQPTAAPLTAPADVVHECLTLLRRPELDNLAPFFPPGVFDPAVRRVSVPVGGQLVEEAGPLAGCAGFMDAAARRVLPGHLLRRCRVLSSMQLGETCTQRVALTACTGEEAVFVWRLRRRAADAMGAGRADTSAGASGVAPTSSSSSSSNGSASRPAPRPASAAATASPSTSHPGAAASFCGAPASPASASASPSRSASPAADDADAASPSAPYASRTPAWMVESIARDDSRDDDELPPPGLGGAGPHPRCPPELVVKAQLAALRRGDLVGAASYNVWSRSTSGGWELHLAAFRSLLRTPAYHVLLTADEAELGPAAMASGRRMLQEVALLARRPAVGGGAPQLERVATACYGLCMQANGSWTVEGIRMSA